MGDETEEPTTDDDTAADVPAVPTDATGELQLFAEYARTLQVEDPEEVQARILESLLRATSADDILRAGEAMPAAEIVGVPITVLDIRASESTFTEGADLYLHVDAKIISNGDHVTFSCGARDVVTKLIRLHQLHFMPVDVIVRRSERPTREGYHPLFLKQLAPDERPFS